ncbi:6,7-dimethyl-8-ribityllumazine synthase [Caulobacter vibrioides]|uniref:6,7-dimethyl-8-ribityllumazine synthase n=1 Tax=Caulobacter vibrioides TaxID=155892 RepID=UPI000BB4CEC4|nr:6,7-dimethyl-8-ribityllumazine synthase [Caulobacter vibrioides]ATC24288.1 6,7-dimethyl-8-ribityllumazine synthase [Caulobacter vibrioides]AZH12537.1 6,7-dimethyl-8-ribityllumazine synthase [Caulobacter vibrioides]PLR14969.1 6,7-dimethyl-8-ribityllumazine synthase [Caulobacter vibrioides]
MVEDKIRLLIVEGRSHSGISDELLRGATQAIEAQGADYDVITVSNALQIPTVIAMAEDAGHRPVGVRYDGYVALGVVIRGETYHFELVANETARGLQDLGVAKRLPIGFGVLAVDEEAQALSRARVSEGDRGGAAAKACLETIGLKRQLLGQAR